MQILQPQAFQAGLTAKAAQKVAIYVSQSVSLVQYPVRPNKIKQRQARTNQRQAKTSIQDSGRSSSFRNLKLLIDVCIGSKKCFYVTFFLPFFQVNKSIFGEWGNILL